MGQLLAECFEAVVESTLQQPTFVTDFPVEISPLAKPHRSQPGLVERFELYIAGEIQIVGRVLLPMLLSCMWELWAALTLTGEQLQLAQQHAHACAMLPLFWSHA